MTEQSHYDICRWRTVEEQRVLYGDKFRVRISGTEKNHLRRTVQKIGLVWDGPDDEDGESVEVILEVESGSVNETLGGGGMAGTVTPTIVEILENDPAHSPNQKQKRALEKKVKEATKLKERLDGGEKLEVNQIIKAGKVDALREELKALA